MIGPVVKGGTSTRHLGAVEQEHLENRLRILARMIAASYRRRLRSAQGSEGQEKLMEEDYADKRCI